MLKIYLDSNVWSRVFDSPSEKILAEADAFLRILQKSDEGKLAIVGSVVLDLEAGRMENPDKRSAAEQLLTLFASERVYDIPRAKMREIKETTGLKLPDAAHLACAIEMGCKYFITCDDDITRKSPMIERRYGLKVYNPVEFVNMREEEW